MSNSKNTTLSVVPFVDLNRYCGKWYEIARLPNRFERGCEGDTTATYTLRADGKVKVVNQCRKADGTVQSIEGTAKPADNRGTNNKLKVTFFWPFSGDYWVIDLDPEYRWAAVGEPRRKYFWILSREPEMDSNLIDQIRKRAEQNGYDLSQLQKTKQSQRSA